MVFCSLFCQNRLFSPLHLTTRYRTFHILREVTTPPLPRILFCSWAYPSWVSVNLSCLFVIFSWSCEVTNRRKPCVVMYVPPLSRKGFPWSAASCHLSSCWMAFGLDVR